MPEQAANVVFMGSPEFAVPTLDALIADPRFDVVGVVSQPDRPRGRGKKLSPTPVRQRALDNDLLNLQMAKKNYRQVVEQLVGLEPVFIVVAAFGIILRDDLLTLPGRGCINLHASLLPRYRGVSPIQNAILSGERETGCTTMLMDAGVDTGDVLLKRTITIADDDDAGSLEKKLAQIGAPLVVDTLKGILDGTVSPVNQDERLATYTKKIRKEHGLIDWTTSGDFICRHIRAMTPWPSAYTSFRDRRLIVLEARAGKRAQGAKQPGEVVSLEPLVIAAGDGAVELFRVKVEGKKAMSAEDFCRGYRLRVGDSLG